jgi:hypothetical protein
MGPGSATESQVSHSRRKLMESAASETNLKPLPRGPESLQVSSADLDRIPLASLQSLHHHHLSTAVYASIFRFLSGGKSNRGWPGAGYICDGLTSGGCWTDPLRNVGF